MFQHNGHSETSPFLRLNFSEKVLRCLDRADRRSPEATMRPASLSECESLVRDYRRKRSLAEPDTIAKILSRNPAAIQIAEGEGHAPGLLAILPLNDLGLEAIAKGWFSGTNPNPDWIASPKEAASAVYIWLVLMPRSFGRLLSAIAAVVDGIAKQSVPMFSRATNAHALRLQQSAGFVHANGFYPGCRSDLMVVFPKAELVRKCRPAAAVRLARTIEEMMQVFTVRSATYLAEQFCSYAEEFDGNDFCATHWLGTVDGDAAGCIRARFFAGFAKIERLAVRAEYRNSRLAYSLVRAALDHCAQKGYTRIIGHSRVDLVRFWRVFGFRPAEGRTDFSFANVRYVEMIRETDSAPDAISFDAPPMVIIRPEGAWRNPGPFERIVHQDDDVRRLLIAERTRSVRGQRISA